MKKKPVNYTMIVSCAIAGLVLAGCAQQQQHGRYKPASTTTAVEAPKAAPAPAAPAGGYGPSYSRFEENGIRYTRGSMAFPSGLRESSGLLVEKTVPAEVLAGQSFAYTYKVSNLTDYPIQDVTLMDHVSPNFKAAEASPRPTENRDGLATWKLGNMGAKESKTISIRGSSAEEGAIETCGWATYSPVLCEDIKVVKANIQLVKTAPKEVIICDAIPMTLTVRNTGSSGLTGVKVTDPLPQGLTSDGKTSLSFDAGNLGPGESKEFKFNAVASKTGEFANKAQVTSTQGVKAEAAATTVVREPVLAVACQAPDQRFMGRPFDVVFTVNSKGDTAAADTVLEVPVPSGLTARSASNGGQISGGKITWSLGSLAVDAARQVTASFVGASGGNFEFKPSVKGSCAKLVTSSCRTVVVGMSALLLEKADDPDPIAVGETTTYTVKVTNQGTADDTNIKMVVEFPAEISPVSASNSGEVQGKRVTFPPFPRLAPKQAFTYTIQAKGEKVGDARVKFIRTSDGIPAPTTAEESTRVY